jgi:hypothetical protein
VIIYKDKLEKLNCSTILYTSLATLKGSIMEKNDLFTPIFKKIDKVIFGFEEINDVEKQSQFIECDNDDEYDVERSTN